MRGRPKSKTSQVWIKTKVFIPAQSTPPPFQFLAGGGCVREVVGVQDHHDRRVGGLQQKATIHAHLLTQVDNLCAEKIVDNAVKSGQADRPEDSLLCVL
jgi:hypothetical protein